MLVVLMDHFRGSSNGVRMILRILLFSLFVLLCFGCSMSSFRVSSSREQRLRQYAVTASQFGIRRSAANNDYYEMPLCSADIDEAVVIVPMEFTIFGHPALQARFDNKKSFQMVVDTGAQMNLIEARRALPAKPETCPAFSFNMLGIAGEEKGLLARFARVQIGTMELNDFAAVIRLAHSQIRLAGLPVYEMEWNIIGTPFLQCFRYVTFDFPRKRFLFSIGETFKPRSADAIRIPMKVWQHSIYIPLTLGKHTIEARVDTGSNEALFLDLELIRNWKLDAALKAGKPYWATGIGGEVRGRWFRVRRVFLGKVPFFKVPVHTGKELSLAEVGVELLKPYRVTFDFAGGAMWLE